MHSKNIYGNESSYGQKDNQNHKPLLFWGEGGNFKRVKWTQLTVTPTFEATRCCHHIHQWSLVQR